MLFQPAERSGESGRRDSLPKPSDAHCGFGAGQSAHLELPGSLMREASSFFL